MKKEERARFAEHASPAAISEMISAVNKKLRRAQAEMTWLRGLQAERASQVLRGEWPPRKKEGS